MLLLRGARRGCFHPRSLAVLTCSLPQRAFSRWRVSLAAAVYRLLLRGLHGYSLLYAISRPVSSPRADKIRGWGLLPVGDGVPDVPYGTPPITARRGGRPCPPERIMHGRGGTHGSRPTDGCGNPPLPGLSRRKRLALRIHDVAPVQVAPIQTQHQHLGGGQIAGKGHVVLVA